MFNVNILQGYFFEQQKGRFMSEKISKKSIREGLEALGISRGDYIVMHSNLKSLGPARVLVKLPQCGADPIIDAFLDVFESVAAEEAE